MDALNPMAQEFLNRIKDSVERNSAMGRLSSWLTKNTTLHGLPFTFDGHEYQVDIIDDTHPNSAIIKPSQTGMSEAASRLTLSFLAVTNGAVGIYTLPTIAEATRFAKSRIDPVIEGSKVLLSAMMGGSDSASFKRVGSSQLFMQGTFGKAIISIPADFLINDEVDFSNAENLITAESRLSHSRIYDAELDIRGIRRKFSTPTIPNFGVSALYEQSDRRQRLVKCKSCAKWFWPNFLEHVIVPGFDGSMKEISYLDVQVLETRGLIARARIICPHCHNTVTKENLRPEYRQWVAENLSVTHQRGWAVSPFDLPDYHTPASLLRKKLEYKEEEGHFRNFALGLAHADASNSVIIGAARNNATLDLIRPEAAGTTGMVLGLDVGKTSWLLVGKPKGLGIDVVWAEQIKLIGEDDDNLFKIVCERMVQFKVIQAVLDAMPYTDTMLRIQKRFPEGMVLLCTYSIQDKKAAVTKIRKSDFIIEAHRTRALDNVVKKLNANRIQFAKCPEVEVIEAHLQGMKRIDRVTDDGESVSDWVRTGPDHYFHTLNYLNMAASQVVEEFVSTWSPGIQVHKAKVGGRVESERPIDPLHLFRKR